MFTKINCSSPLLKRPPPLCKEKVALKRLASLGGDTLVVFYNLRTSEIWPDKIKSYALMVQMRLPFIDSDLLYRGAI